MCKHLLGNTCQIDKDYCTIPKDCACRKRVDHRAAEPPSRSDAKCGEKNCEHYRKDGCLTGCTPSWEIQTLHDRIAELERTGTDMLYMYIGVIDSGDCGNWNPREDEEVVALRAAIDKARK